MVRLTFGTSKNPGRTDHPWVASESHFIVDPPGRKRREHLSPPGHSLHCLCCSIHCHQLWASFSPVCLHFLCHWPVSPHSIVFLRLFASTRSVCGRSLNIMADVANAPTAVEQQVKPQRPDEQTFKADLEKAEKELAVAQKNLVRCAPRC